MLHVFDGIVYSKMKDSLVLNMSKFQIGAKPGHRAQEHIFVLNSEMALYKKLNISLIIQNGLFLVILIGIIFSRHRICWQIGLCQGNVID